MFISFDIGINNTYILYCTATVCEKANKASFRIIDIESADAVACPVEYSSEVAGRVSYRCPYGVRSAGVQLSLSVQHVGIHNDIIHEPCVGCSVSLRHAFKTGVAIHKSRKPIKLTGVVYFIDVVVGAVVVDVIFVCGQCSRLVCVARVADAILTIVVRRGSCA